jgi:hypothetical protein
MQGVKSLRHFCHVGAVVREYSGRHAFPAGKLPGGQEKTQMRLGRHCARVSTKHEIAAGPDDIGEGLASTALVRGARGLRGKPDAHATSTGRVVVAPTGGRASQFPAREQRTP